MYGLCEKVRVVATNLLTVLVAVQTLVTVVVIEFADVPVVAEYGAVVVTGVASVVAFVRRVAPVEAAERGLT